MSGMRTGPARLMGAAAMAGVLALAACDSGTDPRVFSSGEVSFQWVEEGDESAPQTWSAEGSCGSRGFLLGSSTCAVASEEPTYWAALGVLVGVNDAFGVITVAHPREEGTCEASATSGSTCGLAFTPAYTVGQQNVISYILTSGTVTVAVEESGDVDRMTGTFEGRAEATDTTLPALIITGGTLDVELVR